MFDVFYSGENKNLKAQLPLAVQVEDVTDIRARTKMYWFVEENVEVTDYSVFDYRPPEYDADYEHIWKWQENKYGGIFLKPTYKDPIGQKELDRIVCKKKFDIFYAGENPGMEYHVPHAIQVQDIDEVKSKTHMYWFVEPNIELIDYSVFDYRPEQWDQTFIHEFKWNSSNYGGVTLYPVAQEGGDKQINRIVCKKRFDILRKKTPGQYFRNHPHATHVWCVDEEYKIDFNIDWAPGNFEPDFIHTFHLRGQLEHKYPAEEGGVKLYPRNYMDATIKFHKYLDAAARYPVKRVFDITKNKERDEFDDDYVWLIDEQYKINEDTLDWVPNPFESDFIHQFKMPYQLNDKYPGIEGGIKLVPKDYKGAIQKIHNGTILHLDCPVVDIQYDVFYINEELDEQLMEQYAKRSETDYFWLVDKDFDINGALRYVPSRGEEEFNHVFNIPTMVEDKYPTEEYELNYANDPKQLGGIWLIKKDFDATKWKFQNETIPVRYDIFYTDDINTNLEPFARKSTTSQFWLVESKSSITAELNWVCPLEYQRSINQFTFGNGESAVNVKLVPKKYEYAQTVQQSKLSNMFEVAYETYTTEEEGRTKTELDWFWVIDPDVEVHEGFNFEFLPERWDGSYLNEGKAHVWQKLNPITGRQYDYHGVMLCPREPSGKGRPKYIMEPACTQREYPVYKLDANKDTIDQLEKADRQTKSGMYWVVDAYTDLAEDWDYSYYPTQYDTSKIHVFADEDGIYRNVRLYPKGTFGSGHKFNAGDVAYNRFTPVQDVKRINTVASNRPSWPVFEFADFTTLELKAALKVYAKKKVPYMWTVDPDVTVNRQRLYSKFSPGTINEEGETVIPDFDSPNVNKVHSWQRLTESGKVINNSGLRLWPTDYDVETITDEQLRFNDIQEQIYVSKPGCTQPDYKVYALQGNADIIEQLEQFDNKSPSSMYWVTDPFTKVLGEWEWDYFPSKYDEQYVHVLKTMEGEHRNIRLYPKGTFKGEHGYTLEKIDNNSFEGLKKLDIEASSQPTHPVIDLADITKDQFLEQLSDFSQTHGFVWTKDGDVDALDHVINSGFLPAMNNVHKVHVWQRMNPHTDKVHSYGGLRLWPTANDYSELTSDELKLNKIKNLQYVRKPGCTYKPYEIVFLSYHEPFAETSYKRLTARFDARWVKDIEGIFTAHKQAANEVQSSMFWVVDADADISEDFDFSYVPDAYDQDVVHVWNSKNPVTGEEYGYGGVKLFNTEQVMEANSWGLDFTTGLSKRFKALPEISCTTKFNTDAYSTWRSAFRECVKLAAKVDDSEAKQRLEGWLNPLDDADYKEDALAGAKAGIEYANKWGTKPLKMAKINDYEWLEEHYNEQNSS